MGTAIHTTMAIPTCVSLISGCLLLVICVLLTKEAYAQDIPANYREQQSENDLQPPPDASGRQQLPPDHPLYEQHQALLEQEARAIEEQQQALAQQQELERALQEGSSSGNPDGDRDMFQRRRTLDPLGLPTLSADEANNGDKNRPSNSLPSANSRQINNILGKARKIGRALSQAEIRARDFRIFSTMGVAQYEDHKKLWDQTVVDCRNDIWLAGCMANPKHVDEYIKETCPNNSTYVPPPVSYIVEEMEDERSTLLVEDYI